MVEKIGLLVNQVVLDAQLKCERCKIRPAYQGRKWCKRCQQWWQRHNHKPLLNILDGVLGLRYCRARLFHLNKSLLKEFQRLPDDQSIMLWGDVGCGKTYAMAALARRFFIQGWDVIFIRWYELVLSIRQSYEKRQSELEIIKPFCETDKLFIDDIGLTANRDSQESDFNTRTLDLILDKRLANFRPTFITSNHNIEDLSKTFDERIASRLQENCLILQLKGKDKRILL